MRFGFCTVHQRRYKGPSPPQLGGRTRKSANPNGHAREGERRRERGRRRKGGKAEERKGKRGKEKEEREGKQRRLCNFLRIGRFEGQKNLTT